jgi:hypothetical protein
MIIEDIDFSSHFCNPDNAAFRRYVQLYTDVVIRKGGHPHIGPRLPELLRENGFSKIGTNVIQPAGTEGEVKQIAAITMENIADAVIQAELATPNEIQHIMHELHGIAADMHTYISLPRIVQAWGYRP